MVGELDRLGAQHQGADGLSATTRRDDAEPALPELRRLKAEDAPVALDASARQVLRIVRARPLADDPVPFGRQRDVAAPEVVDSGVDASATGAGKTVTSGRALPHRATPTRRLGALVMAEGRCSAKWRDDLTLGAPGGALPPLVQTSSPVP